MQSLSPLVTFLTLTGFAIAQTDPARQEAAPLPRFEVASIKPSAPDARPIYRRSMAGGVINQDNVTVEELMVNACHVQPYQISGGPAWIRTVRYDISAKPEKQPEPGRSPADVAGIAGGSFRPRGAS